MAFQIKTKKRAVNELELRIEKGMSGSKASTIDMRCHHCAGPLSKDMVKVLNFFFFL